MTGCVFAIQKFSTRDGPGIRTTVFLKGCPLRCLWCHNPESQSPECEIAFLAARCIGCGACAAACPAGCHDLAGGRRFDRSGCTRCGRCVEACCAGALEKIGKFLSPEEVLREVLLDRRFYERSGGGMTVSGGEPMAQFPFTLALCKAAKAEHLHVALDTSGEAPREQYEAMLPFVDLFLYDLKAADPVKHRTLTGRDNARILENLRFLDRNGAAVLLRCPLVPGLNDSEDDLAGIAGIANGLARPHDLTVHPYHPLGVEKSLRIGRRPALEMREFAAPETVDRWLAFLRSRCRCGVALN